MYAAARSGSQRLFAELRLRRNVGRQHNEPGGNQDVWLFHAHVFPRRDGDRLYAGDEDRRWAEADERAP